MAFDWQDPLLLEDQLNDDEKIIRDSVRRYCRDKLMPRIQTAFREAKWDREVLREFGELGILGEEGEPPPDDMVYTRVEDAVQFARETGVDALAVAIGNAHGLYKKEPKLDFERLDTICRSIDAPVVLHGGSGIPENDIVKAISLGITKINIGAEMRIPFFNGFRAALEAGGPEEKWPYNLYPEAVRQVSAVIEEKLRLFGSAGKA